MADGRKEKGFGVFWVVVVFISSRRGLEAYQAYNYFSQKKKNRGQVKEKASRLHDLPSNDKKNRTNVPNNPHMVYLHIEYTMVSHIDNTRPFCF